MDDSTIVLDRLSAMLAELGWVEVVGRSTDADEAIAAFKTYRPDVVVVDIRLASSSGLDVVNYIQKCASKVIVIVLTNYPDARYRQLYLDAGADYFFDKSCEFDRVPAVLESLLAV
ncbi:MAG TPA: response regulator [Anaerolineae bacterium]